MSLKDFERKVLAEPGTEPRVQSLEDELREQQHRARVKELAAEILEKDAELLERLAEGEPQGTGWCAPSP